MRATVTLAVIAILMTLASACEPGQPRKAHIVRTGAIQNMKLDEASGMQASLLNPGVYFVHNDDGKPVVFAMDAKGADLGLFELENAKNRDWEDITRVPSESGPLLVLADIGDNFARYKHVKLYFVSEPVAGSDGRYSGSYPLAHEIKLRYPDGARDCESLSYDPWSGRLFFMSKRDRPQRVYSIALQEALDSDDAELRFEGETTTFRPPSSRDVAFFGRKEAQWVAQPTGMDINQDGTQAAVISYRSLFLFERKENESWAAAFARQPREFEGPPSRHEEALAWSADGESILMTTEKIPAPVYRFLLTPEQD